MSHSISHIDFAVFTDLRDDGGPRPPGEPRSYRRGAVVFLRGEHTNFLSFQTPVIVSLLGVAHDDGPYGVSIRVFVVLSAVS
jgi:hypothetical protein